MVTPEKMTEVQCPHCGQMTLKVGARCRQCGAARSHRDCYPDQYQHPLVGKTVKVSAGLK